MLSLFVRCIVIYFFLLVAMRLMGKRQLGELQPFEFAITLVASELACIPMNDPTVPIIYGIIPVFTLFLVHIIITKLAVKSVRFRKVLNGKPVVVIEKGNLLPDVLKELNMNIDDLLEALRGNGYFNPGEVEYATPADMDMKLPPAAMPITVIMEGNFMGASMVGLDWLSKERVLKLLESIGMEQKDVLLMLVTGDEVFVQPYERDSLTVFFGSAEKDDKTRATAEGKI